MIWQLATALLARPASPWRSTVLGYNTQSVLLLPPAVSQLKRSSAEQLNRTAYWDIFILYSWSACSPV
jgi:hypothetical protein